MGEGSDDGVEEEGVGVVRLVEDGFRVGYRGGGGGSEDELRGDEVGTGDA